MAQGSWCGALTAPARLHHAALRAQGIHCPSTFRVQVPWTAMTQSEGKIEESCPNDIMAPGLNEKGGEAVPVGTPTRRNKAISVLR